MDAKNRNSPRVASGRFDSDPGLASLARSRLEVTLRAAQFGGRFGDGPLQVMHLPWILYKQEHAIEVEREPPLRDLGRGCKATL